LKVDLNVSITLSALEKAKILKVEYNMEGTKKGRKLRLSWERKNLVADSILQHSFTQIYRRFRKTVFIHV